MRRPLPNIVAVLACCLAFGVSTTSCGGGAGGVNGDLVLLGFNQPEVAGVALNQPLVFTFSTNVDADSITPDSLRVVGQKVVAPFTSVPAFFEETVVDGNLVALIPRSPNFDDYTDCGLLWDSEYGVTIPVFPNAFVTIESTDGRPLVQISDSGNSYTYTFRTVVASRLFNTRTAFVETFRPLVHGLDPRDGGNSDDFGCLQNRNNSLYVTPDINDPAGAGQQTFSGPGARLLCYENEGAPRVIPELCVPLHDQRAVGTPSAGSNNVGRVDLPAIVVAINEQVDPVTVTPYTPTTKQSINLQLWRVALLDGTPLSPPEQIQVNKPLLVQSQGSTQIILVPSGPVLQGIYMVNTTANVRDLAQNRLRVDDDPSLTGSVYQALDAGFGAAVPAGWRMYFQTLLLPNTASALAETFGSNLGEWGDLDSLDTEPGVFTQRGSSTTVLDPIAGIVPGGASQPSYTLTYSGVLASGQSTTANWNNGYRFLNIRSLEVNTDADSGLGRLKATHKPYLGTGGDGVLDTSVAPFTAGTGDVLALSTTPGPGASINGDGIYEYESFHLRAGDILTATGNQPLLILCRGNFVVDGQILLSGSDGGFGADTDGSTKFTAEGARESWGAGGSAGPGGGQGGRGGGPNLTASTSGTTGQSQGQDGARAKNMLGEESQGAGLAGTNAQGAGGGGGGHASVGSTGTLADGSGQGNAGNGFGNSLLELPLTAFQPDRGYQPNAGTTGGPGAGGGSADDDGDSALDNGDDSAGGGGGGGGALWVIAGGLVEVGAAGQILADGGDGGSTYGAAALRIVPGVNPQTGNPDPARDYYDGLKASPGAPSGKGGPGGGGAGGAICLVGEGGVTLQTGAVLSAMGGAGGTNSVSGMVGGAGSEGRILLLDMGRPATTVTTNSAAMTPGATVSTWRPTVDLASAGVSTWVDLFVPTVDWAPVVGGVPQVPFHTDNFDFLTTTSGLLFDPSGDFHFVLEYQGADDLFPAPGGGFPPSTAVGATQWNPDINSADGRRFFRWRARFFVRDGYPGSGLSALPMPALLDLTIPLVK